MNSIPNAQQSGTGARGDTGDTVAGRNTAPLERWIEHGRLRLNINDRLAQVDGIAIALTRSEFELLAALFYARGRVCTKHKLVLLLRTDTSTTSNIVLASDRRAIQAHITNLRRKMLYRTGSTIGRHALDELPGIETVRGVGYRLSASLGF